MALGACFILAGSGCSNETPGDGSTTNAALNPSSAPAGWEKGAAKVFATPPFRHSPNAAATYSSFDRAGGQTLPKGSIRFTDADVDAVLRIYQEVSGRAIIRSPNLPAAKINFTSESPLSRPEVLQALDTVLAANGITMVLLGTRFAKAVPFAQVSTEPAPVIELPPEELPESSSYMIYIVPLSGRDPNRVLPVLQPFAKMPVSLISYPDAGILILRDYSANVRRMMEVLATIEQTPALETTPPAPDANRRRGVPARK